MFAIVGCEIVILDLIDSVSCCLVVAGVYPTRKGLKRHPENPFSTKTMILPTNKSSHRGSSLLYQDQRRIYIHSTPFNFRGNQIHLLMNSGFLAMLIAGGGPSLSGYGKGGGA